VGNAGSAPNFMSLSAQGGPTDNQLGYIPGQGPATLIISNGTFTTSARMNTGPVGGATGIVDVVGGTVTIASQFQGANGAATAGSQLNVSGGSFTTPGTLFVSSRGVGFLNISGTGEVSCATVDVSRNANSGGSGIVNLNGGSLTTGRVGTETANSQTTGTPYAQFNFNGGALVASAGSATFFQGSIAGGMPLDPINTYVEAGGAIINDGGNAITFLEELQHTNGVAVDGGLTKLGVGTVTLAKTNTYNGATLIGAGTLALSGSGTNYATPVYIISSNATLNVAGLAAVPMALQPNQTISNTAPTATIVGSLATGSGKLALTYLSGSPSLTVTTGTLTLSAGTALTINNTGAALTPGTYSIISTGAGGALVGTPSSFTVTGGGVQAGLNTSLVNTGTSLNLVVAAPTPPVITGIRVSGVTLTITATNGAVGGSYTLLESTNLLLPLNQWTPVFTNNFNGSGDINLSTNVVNPNNPQMFYLLQVPLP
jgi:fibronectin-binding autotransporter adhesin